MQISVDRLRREFGSVTAVDDLSFRVAAGEIVGLLGPNGAGKTTTILMMLGLTDVSGGEVRVLGHDPVREPLAVKRRVGYLPEERGLYPNMKAREAIAFLGALRGLDFAGGDLVEVAPSFDHGTLTAFNAASILFEILCLLAEARAARTG